MEEKDIHKKDSERNETAGAGEEYSFLREKIKDKPFNWKQLWQKACFAAGAGIIFGVCVCMAFYGLKPWAEAAFQKTPNKITLPVDEDPPEPTQIGEEPERAKNEALNEESLWELNRATYDIAREAWKCMAEVTVHPSDEEWLSENGTEGNSAAGIILADNGREVLVMTESRLFRDDGDVISIKLPDEEVYEASLKRMDNNLGLAVAAINKTKLPENIWSHMQQANYGNSNRISRGDFLIVLGKPFGTSGGMAYGIISSMKLQVNTADGACKVIESNIMGQDNSSGIAFDLNGKFVGIVRQNLGGQNHKRLIALPISEIRDQMELLLNGRGVPYIGIIGVDVPDSVAESQNIPDGIYVREVEPDSPAMQVGIQSGDIIVAVNDTEVLTLANYKNNIMKYTTGQKIKIKVKRAGTDKYVDITYDITVGSKE